MNTNSLNTIEKDQYSMIEYLKKILSESKQVGAKKTATTAKFLSFENSVILSSVNFTLKNIIRNFMTELQDLQNNAQKIDEKTSGSHQKKLIQNLTHALLVKMEPELELLRKKSKLYAELYNNYDENLQKQVHKLIFKEDIEIIIDDIIQQQEKILAVLIKFRNFIARLSVNRPITYFCLNLILKMIPLKIEHVVFMIDIMECVVKFTNTIAQKIKKHFYANSEKTKPEEKLLAENNNHSATIATPANLSESSDDEFTDALETLSNFSELEEDSISNKSSVIEKANMFVISTQPTSNSAASNLTL